MKKVAIIGPGLLGGSIALALRERGEWNVAIWARRPEAVEEARAGGFADLASTNLEEVVNDAQLVVLCTPINSMEILAIGLAPFITPQTLITDVGSVKAPIVSALSPIFQKRGHFVGSHPMAGSEQSGMKFARADLFEGAVCIVTPDGHSQPAAIEAIQSFWQSLGCSVHQFPADEHDRMVAAISHFPHLLAAALVEMIAANEPAAFDFCGPGFRDTTRVASGSPAMWTEILQANRGAVRKSAEAMIEKLHEIIRLLGTDCPAQQMHEFLTHAKARRDRLRLPRL